MSRKIELWSWRSGLRSWGSDLTLKTNFMKGSFLILILVASLHCLYAQTTIQKSYNTSINEVCIGNSFIKLSNGDYLLVGRTTLTPMHRCLYVIRIDSIGDEIWSKYYDGLYTENNITSIIELTDSTFYITGGIGKIPSGGFYDYGSAFGLIINGNGDVINCKLFADPLQDSSYVIRKSILFNGHIYSVGRIFEFDSSLGYNGNETKGLLLKSDLTGQILWAKKYENNNLNFVDFTLSYDSGFVIAGSVETFDSTGSTNKLIYLKADTNGVPVWNFEWDITPEWIITNSVKKMGNGFVICGRKSGLGFDSDGFVISCDSSGGVIWAKQYGWIASSGDEVKYSTKLNNGNLLFMPFGLCFLYTDSIGNNPVIHLIANYPYGSFNEIRAEENGGISGIGTTSYSLFFHKTDSSLFSCFDNANTWPNTSLQINPVPGVINYSSINIPNSSYNFIPVVVSSMDSTFCYTSTSTSTPAAKKLRAEPYPNPCQNNTSVNIDSEEIPLVIKVIELTGREISCDYSFNKNKITITTSRLNSGFYTLKIITRHKQFVSQFIKNN